jgi:predicted O-methyltransferase YrrM
MSHISNPPQQSFPAREAWSDRSCSEPQTKQTDVQTNKPLAVLARRLRENETIASLMTGSFRILQRIGISVTPNHFYWPIPDVAELEKREWPAELPTETFDFRLDRQVNLLHKLAAEYGSEWVFPDQSGRRLGKYHYNNGFFESVDAEIAYSLVRLFKPRRIIEIGTGFSTRVLAAALKANLDRDGAAGELVSIDPIPERLPQNGFSSLVRVMPRRVQDVDLGIFQSLGENDILFIDSSHVVATGSDVVREYLEILPSLRSGVLVHVHDIFLPSDYPREAVLKNMCLWSEQYMLQAFLSFNSSFEVVWASSAMQSFQRHELDAVFPRWKTSYEAFAKSQRRWVPSRDKKRTWPSSFWIRRV